MVALQVDPTLYIQIHLLLEMFVSAAAVSKNSSEKSFARLRSISQNENQKVFLVFMFSSIKEWTSTVDFFPFCREQ